VLSIDTKIDDLDDLIARQLYLEDGRSSISEDGRQIIMELRTPCEKIWLRHCGDFSYFLFVISYMLYFFLFLIPGTSSP